MTDPDGPGPFPSHESDQEKEVKTSVRVRQAVSLDPRARRAWPFLAPTAPPGSWWQGPDGQLVQVREDGGADPWPAAGHRSIASDPTARRRSP